MIELPKIIFVSDLARKIGWSTQRTRRWLKTLGVLERMGRKYVTTRTELSLKARAIYQVIRDDEWDELECH